MYPKFFLRCLERRLAYLESKILEATQAFVEKQKKSDQRIAELVKISCSEISGQSVFEEGIVRQQVGLSDSAHKGQSIGTFTFSQ